MDPIADMLTSIRNALAVQGSTVKVPFSNLKYEIVKILEKSGFIKKVEKKGRKINKVIEITLRYNNKTPAILGLKKISKPGQRIYLNSSQIKKIRGGYGITIISTSKGLITDREARRQKIGGEILCKVW